MQATQPGSSKAGKPFLKRGWVKILLLFILADAGITSFFWAYNNSQTAFGSQSWPATTGTILSSKATAVRQRYSGVYYELVVNYQYQVAGVTYNGNGISQNFIYPNNLADADAFLKQYPPGKQVPVYYNPQSPGDAYLQPGATSSSWVVLVMGLLITVLAIWLMVRIIRGMVHPAKEP